MSVDKKRIVLKSSNNLEQQTVKTVQNYSYNTRNLIGKGFSSLVYEGRNTDTNDKVAIKVIDLHKLEKNTMHELLESEITIIKILNHRNILKCENVLITVNNCYIVTEICRGGDLASILSKKGRLRGMEALKVMIDITKGYIYLAGLRVLHRDIKPANILMDAGVAKIADFGFARFEEKSKKEKYNVGSPLYMSPEALNHNLYSKQSDIWSLGIVFYQILQGRPPWSPKNEKELRAMFKKKQEIRFRIAVRDQLENMIKSCLIFEPDGRVTPQGILDTLESILQEMTAAQQGKGEFMYRETLTRKPNCNSHSILPNLQPITSNYTSTNNLLLNKPSVNDNDENKQKSTPPVPPRTCSVKLQQISNQPHYLNLVRNKEKAEGTEEEQPVKPTHQKLSHEQVATILQQQSPMNVINAQSLDQLKINTVSLPNTVNLTEKYSSQQNCLKTDARITWDRKQHQRSRAYSTHQNIENSHAYHKNTTRMQQPVTTEQASRLNHKLLKSVINFSRFTFKLFPKVEKIANIDDWIKQRIEIEMLSILKFIVTTLSSALKTEDEGARFGIKMFSNFAETRCYSKTVLVVEEYYTRYTSYVCKKQAKIINPSCPQKLPIFSEFAQFRQSAARITKVMKLLPIIFPSHVPLQDFENEHNIALDHLASLVILLKILSQNKVDKFAQLSSIQDIVDTVPNKLLQNDLQKLEYKIQLLSDVMETVTE